jgi:hypothetical protein
MQRDGEKPGRTPSLEKTSLVATIAQCNIMALQGILSIPIHAFVTSVQINHFCDFIYDSPLWQLVKQLVVAKMITKWFAIAYATYICD